MAARGDRNDVRRGFTGWASPCVRCAPRPHSILEGGDSSAALGMAGLGDRNDVRARNGMECEEWREG